MSNRSHGPSGENFTDNSTGNTDTSQDQRDPMSPGSLLDRLLGKESGLKEQLDKNARALAQSALGKLDVVSRQEFDAQSAVLKRTRQRVAELEAELERLTQLLDTSPRQ